MSNDLIKIVDGLLAKGLTLDQIATELGMPKGTLYSRIRARGYKLEKFGRLTPIHAPALDSTQREAAA